MLYFYNFILNFMKFSKFGGNFYLFNFVIVNIKDEILCCYSKFNRRFLNVLFN